MSAALIFANQNWKSDININQFPYSNVMNLYLHLMQLYPKNAQHIARAKITLGQHPTPLDKAILDVLGKRFEIKDNGQQKACFNHFPIEPLYNVFASKKHLLDWMNTRLNSNSDVTVPEPSKPRKIFAVAKTDQHWIAAQNRQDLHRAYHAEVLLLNALIIENKTPESIWISLSPCRMCAGLVHAYLNQNSLHGIKVYYANTDHGPLAKNTLLQNKLFQSSLDEVEL